MKKIRIPIMIQDPSVAQLPGLKAAEGTDAVREFFLDGPITERVAVLDFDPETGELGPGARFNPGKILGRYENQGGEDLYDLRDDPGTLHTPEFMQVSVFGTVLRTMDLFKEADTLGRPLTWAFDAPQLLIIPRAGELANAYYQRDSHSLQFFFKGGVYTCLSRDIVAHETGHAIVDGIAPDLLDAYTPQSLAIHEAIADLTAMLLAFSSHSLTHYLLETAKGSITGINPFTTIAEEFGQAGGHAHGLRTLFNDKALDAEGSEGGVNRTEPHELSEVLSGALCQVMVKIDDALRAKLGRGAKTSSRYRQSWGTALAKSSERFKRMTFRALDYLPPGEISFGDYGRALIAVDQVAYPGDPKMRQWIRKEFARRNMVKSEAALDLDTNIECEQLAQMDIYALCTSDWVAYQFADAHRDLLGIPEQVSFTVAPRLRVLKHYDGDEDGHPTGRECIFKVSWNAQEDNPSHVRLPGKRQITVGTTLVIHPQKRCVLCRLSNAPPAAEAHPDRLAELERQRVDRDEFLLKLADSGALRIGSHALAPDGQPFLSGVRADVAGDVMRLRGSGNMLHIMRGDDDG
jgi:hypothetical protein